MGSPCLQVLLLSTLLINFGMIRAHYTEYEDLTYPVSEHTIFFPGQRNFTLDKDYEVENPWYASYSFCMGEHGGTHLDAPVHFYSDGWSIDQIPAEVLIEVQGTVVDIEPRVIASRNPGDYALSVQDLLDHEEEYGPIPSSGLVLVHTGWGKFWGNRTQYLGVQPDGVTLRFPGISEEAALWLYNERRIVGIGLDTASVDPGHSETYPAHRFLASKQVYNLENVAHMDRISKRLAHKAGNTADSSLCDSFIFYVIPVKIVGGTGAPVRILSCCAANFSVAVRNGLSPILLALIYVFKLFLAKL